MNFYLCLLQCCARDDCVGQNRSDLIDTVRLIVVVVRRGVAESNASVAPLFKGIDIVCQLVCCASIVRISILFRLFPVHGVDFFTSWCDE